MYDVSLRLVRSYAEKLIGRCAAPEINTEVCPFSEVNTEMCLLSFLARKCVFLIQSLVRGTEVCLFAFCARKYVLSDTKVLSPWLESEDEARHCSHARPTASGEVRRCIARG